MRILMVNKFLYPRGGSESYMLKLGKQYENMGHTVEYFGMYDDGNTVGNKAGLYTQNMDFHSKGISRFLYPFKIIYSTEAKKKIGKVIDEFKPDVVHMNNINFQLTPSIIYAVKKRGIPLVQTVHDYQMICPNHLLYNFMDGKACVECVKGSRMNCLKYKCIHGSGIKSLIGVIEGFVYSILKTYKLVDLYICPSNFLERKLTDGKAFYKDKVFTIHNFIDKVETEKGEAMPYIAYIGRLSKEKGVELLAETAKKYPEYKFVVGGSGPDEDVFKDIENVQLAGFLNGEKLINTVKNAKALILPSVCFENCPLSILEAHSMGVPVITMNYGGMAELVEDGVTGCLIAEPTPECVGEAIKKITESEESYIRIKENCINRSQEILTVDTYAKIIIEKYNELMR